MSDILVGTTINDMLIADDDHAILFKTDKGDIVARTDGDCCSNTWIEHIELPALGFPCKVLEVEDISMDCPESEEYNWEVIQFYGFKIVTDKGHIIIDYRNASNGYYGGNLSWPDNSYYYGGVNGQNISTENWVKING